jgi:hypothetical protein
MATEQEVLSPLYAVPSGYECETKYGMFYSVSKWKTHARIELRDWLEQQRNSQTEPMVNVAEN